MKEENIQDLLKKCLQTYGMSLPEFSEHSGISKSTLQNYKEGKGSGVAKICLEGLLEIYHLRKQVHVLDDLRDILLERLS